MDKMIKYNIKKYAIPATLEQLLQTLVGFVDAWLIAQIGISAVAGVSIANTIINLYIAIFISIGVGATVLVGKQLGAKNEYLAQKYAQQSIIVAVIIGLIIGLTTAIFSEPLLSFLGAKDEVLDNANQFLSIVVTWIVFLSLMNVLTSLVRVSGHSKVPLYVSLLVNIVNISIDYLLIFGIGPFPAMGVIGTAIGTVLSRFIGCLVLFYYLQKTSIALTLNWQFDSNILKEMVTITLPAMMERFMMKFGQVVYYGLILSIGTKVFAAHSIAGNIEAFTHMPGFGFASAASVLMSKSLGEKNYDHLKQYSNQLFRYGAIIMGSLGIGLWFVAPYAATLFTKDQEVINNVVTALRLIALFKAPLAMSLIDAGSLQGIGDTKTPLITTTIGVWVIRMLAVIVLAKYMNLGIFGIWLGIGIDVTMRALYLRYTLNKRLFAITNDKQDSPEL